MSSTPLLEDFREPDVSNAHYVGKTTCTRRAWPRRFLVLTVFGSLVVLVLLRQIYVALTVFSTHYALFGNSRLQISLSEAESIFSETLSTSNLARNWLYQYTQEPHLPGGADNLVQWTLEKFKEYGLHDTHVETYDVYLNQYVGSALRLMDDGKVVYEALLKEDPIDEDPTTQKEAVPIFHAYSASGNVTAAYFYANYGRKEDYAKLVAAGYNLQGKIAIVRYGRILRGLPVKFAEEVGVAGVVMYSDPAEDGEHTPENGYEQYPKGPAKQESSVQRGSVMFLVNGAGDPTTPGYASKKGVKREDPQHYIPKIPSLPVSYRDILPILKSLNGIGPRASVFGDDWVGKLKGYDYSVGLTLKDKQTSQLLNLYNGQKYDLTPIHDVIGVLPGLVSDEVVVIGNHRDAWVRGGAGDPNSGSSVLLEVLRGFQAATAQGYKPYRTIVFASWDGEEFGLLGSTEWAEDHAKWLQGRVVAYLNMDATVTGSALAIGASPLLEDLAFGVLKNVSHPFGGTLYDKYLDGPMKGRIDFLGSGSDFTAFVDYLGIPSLEFVSTNDPNVDPVYHYHSIYDSFHWMDKFCDPGFKLHNAAAQFYGKLLLRTSGLEFSPLSPDVYATKIGEYLAEALKKVPTKWYHEKLEPDYVGIDVGDKAKHLGHPRNHFPLEGHIGKDFTDAVRATKDVIKRFQETATRAVAERNECQKELDRHDVGFWRRIKLLSRLEIINSKFNFLERMFLYYKGLDGRPWFKHIMFASGRFTGYDGQLIPGFQEAVENGDIEDALRWLTILRDSVYMASFVFDI